MNLSDCGVFGLVHRLRRNDNFFWLLNISAKTARFNLHYQEFFPICNMGPRPTRQTAVLKMEAETPLYVLSHSINELHQNFAAFPSLQDLMADTRINFMAVSAAVDTSEAGENSQLAHVKVQFWMDDLRDPVYAVMAPLPVLWSARLYLAALGLTIRRRKMVLSASDTTMGGVHPTLNEVHWLYHQSVENASHILKEENAFYQVKGGASRS